jgi:hypothetical protein
MSYSYNGELLLLNATKNRVTFAIPDHNPFFKSAGRFMAAIVPINDDETITTDVPEASSELSREEEIEAERQECAATLQRLDEATCPLLTYVVMLCKDAYFRRHIGVSNEGEARAYFLGYCRMKSRREVNEEGPRHKFLALYQQFKETL